MVVPRIARAVSAGDGTGRVNRTGITHCSASRSRKRVGRTEGRGGRSDRTIAPCWTGDARCHIPLPSAGIVLPSRAIGGVDRLDRAVVATGTSRAAGLRDPALGATVAPCVAVGWGGGGLDTILAGGACQTV
jgi:hypothetical protein